MKKLVMTVLTILTSGAAYALPVGNPADPTLYVNGLWIEANPSVDFCDPCFNWCDAFSVRYGFYGDYVFDRHLERSGGNRKDFEDFQIDTNGEYIALNIVNRFDIFAVIGITNMNLKANTSVWGSPFSRESELYFRRHFSWSVGVRGTVWEYDCWALGLEGQYFRVNTEIDHFIHYGTGVKTYFDDNNDAKYQDWQVGLGLAYRFIATSPAFALTPYAAFKWSRAMLDLDPLTIVTNDPVVGDRIKIGDARSRKHWGWALGMTVTLSDMLGVTVEGRWADEKAVHVNGQIRF